MRLPRFGRVGDRDWPSEVVWLVHDDFAADGESTTLNPTHSSMSEGASVHIARGWNERYWAPLAVHLAD